MKRMSKILPDMYKELFQPYHSKLCEYVHKHTSMHTAIHSCGSIYKLIPNLIDAGFEILNPVQTNCMDIDPQRLKTEFGKDACFWGGGCDTVAVLNKATPAEVKAHVLERLKIFTPGAGFIMSTVHNILPEVPPENIVAAFDAVEEFYA